MKLNRIFGVNPAKLLSHMIATRGIKAGLGKIRAVDDIPAPKSKN